MREWVIAGLLLLGVVLISGCSSTGLTTFIYDKNILTNYGEVNGLTWVALDDVIPWVWDVNVDHPDFNKLFVKQVDGNNWYVLQTDGNNWYVKVDDANNVGRVTYTIIANPPWRIEPDTNIFESGVSDCAAGLYVYGFDANGGIDCRADLQGAGGSFYNAGGNLVLDTTDNNTFHFNDTNFLGAAHIWTADQNFTEDVNADRIESDKYFGDIAGTSGYTLQQAYDAGQSIRVYPDNLTLELTSIGDLNEGFRIQIDGSDIFTIFRGAYADMPFGVRSYEWYPMYDDDIDLGNINYRWKNLYLSGTIMGQEVGGASTFDLNSISGDFNTVGSIWADYVSLKDQTGTTYGYIAYTVTGAIRTFSLRYGTPPFGIGANLEIVDLTVQDVNANDIYAGDYFGTWGGDTIGAGYYTDSNWATDGFPTDLNCNVATCASAQFQNNVRTAQTPDTNVWSEGYAFDQSVDTTATPTFATLDTGYGAFEMYEPIRRNIIPRLYTWEWGSDGFNLEGRWHAGGQTLVLSDTYAYEGDYSLACSGGGSDNCWLATGAGGYNIDLTPDTNYCLSVYARVAADTATAYLGRRVNNAGYTVVNGTVGTTWTRLESCFATDSDDTSMLLYIPDSTQAVYYDGYMLEQVSGGVSSASPYNAPYGSMWLTYEEWEFDIEYDLRVGKDFTAGFTGNYLTWDESGQVLKAEGILNLQSQGTSNVNVILPDAAGARTFNILDSGLSNKFNVDSDGAVQADGGITTTTGTFSDVIVNTLDAAGERSLFQRNVVSATVPVVEILQDNTSATQPVLELDQDDVSEGFVDFVGSDRGAVNTGSAAPVAINSVASVRVELNGVKYVLPLFADQ